ncbi:holo-ACP synthase, partial [Weissella kandleri]|uniref:holo-ACP synthase n=1 Tax=Weissella kandleri TaxID=1616 RepID=UPI00387E81EB
MIFGHGIDIQTISQVKALAERQPNFIAKILTPAEQEEFNARVGKHRFEFLVGRYAAKEAYGKALGTGIGHGLGWQQLQIINDESGQPVFQMHPKQAEFRAHLSISHTDDLVKASVILENLVTQEVSVSTHRPAWIEISALALAHNVDYIRKLTHAKRFV